LDLLPFEAEWSSLVNSKNTGMDQDRLPQLKPEAPCNLKWPGKALEWKQHIGH
jgi:hypothetical protein